MTIQKNNKYLDIIRGLNLSNIRNAKDLPESLLIDANNNLSIYYAPFDYMNQGAKVVIVGITPGLTQLKNAYDSVQTSLKKGNSIEQALIQAKSDASFSGAMRKNLVEMLDFVGLHNWLEISSCSDLFAEKSNLLHSTSALKYPVFVDNKNYNGTPNMIKNDLLKRHLTEYFGQEVKALQESIFIPLGPKPSEALNFLANAGYLNKERVLLGFPHPSPASMERINYFLGKKPKNQLSIKTNADQIDSAKASIIKKIKSLQ